MPQAVLVADVLWGGCVVVVVWVEVEADPFSWIASSAKFRARPSCCAFASPHRHQLIGNTDTIGGSIFLDREQCQVLSAPGLLCIVPSTPTVDNTARTIVASQRGCQHGCCGGQKK
ncbi:MAG: hypothetical protein QGH82_02160 [Candidatus Woesearchaeota archaeon]|nr:hypothetical protein [Candidatus Woesearchaeota archaeon]